MDCGKTETERPITISDISIREAEEELAGRHDNSLGQWFSDCWKTCYDASRCICVWLKKIAKT